MPDDPIAEHRQRARWRLLGATVFFLASAGLSLWLLRDHPRSLRADFVLMLPAVESVETAEHQREEEARPPVPQSAAVAPPVAVARPAEILPSPAKAEPDAPQRLVQVGAYSTEKAAEAVRRRLAEAGHSARVAPVNTAAGVRYRVRVGPLSESAARAFHERARQQGYEAVLLPAEAVEGSGSAVNRRQP